MVIFSSTNCEPLKVSKFQFQVLHFDNAIARKRIESNDKD